MNHSSDRLTITPRRWAFLRWSVPLSLALFVSGAVGANSQTLGPEPQIFAPGVISGPANDGAPSFTPDGKTLFFTRSGAGGGAIFESHLVDGTWTAPEIAPFSGEYNDQHAAVAPSGKFLVFVSTRPVEGLAQRVAHLWRVDKTPTGWSAPTHLSPAINIGPSIFKPSVARDGTIYFLSIGLNRTFRLFRSRYVNGAYLAAEPLPFSTDDTADVDPEIAPDQSFLVFSSAGRRATDKLEHLYIVFNHGGTWGDVIPLRYTSDDRNGSSNDNEPDLGSDGRTLYFSSDRTIPIKFPRTLQQAQDDFTRINAWDDGNTNVWTLPLDQWLAAPRHG